MIFWDLGQIVYKTVVCYIVFRYHYDDSLEIKGRTGSSYICNNESPMGKLLQGHKLFQHNKVYVAYAEGQGAEGVGNVKKTFKNCVNERRVDFVPVSV